jgi:hypothetical protein
MPAVTEPPDVDLPSTANLRKAAGALTIIEKPAMVGTGSPNSN